MDQLWHLVRNPWLSTPLTLQRRNFPWQKTLAPSSPNNSSMTSSPTTSIPTTRHSTNHPTMQSPMTSIQTTIHPTNLPMTKSPWQAHCWQALSPTHQGQAFPWWAFQQQAILLTILHRQALANSLTTRIICRIQCCCPCSTRTPTEEIHPCVFTDLWPDSGSENYLLRTGQSCQRKRVSDVHFPNLQLSFPCLFS